MREARRAGAVVELFATAEAMTRYPELTADADEISAKDAAALSETVTPQGLIAVCRLEQPDAADVLEREPRLLALLVEPGDPGNVGTAVRTADAAGADAVFLSGGADPYNGKAVRASAGSLFHLPVVGVDAAHIVAAAATRGLLTLATTARGTDDLDHLDAAGVLARPTLWVFGSEAHGLPPELVSAAERSVRIPVHGAAESLNLAASVAVALYASARAQRR